jgi:putative glutamate/gamma-aminobutyrate antiporter
MEKRKVLSVFVLAMINVAAICNIGNLSFTAQLGFSSVFFYILGCIIFFIPAGLISAELATGWPERGGVYTWVREALGEKFGFVAIWMQWAENIIWYPTILSFTAATGAYIIDPALASNKIYITIMILSIFWIVTIVNFLGMKVSGWISTVCVIIGVFIPAALIISLGVSWLILGHASQISYSFGSLIPEMTSISQFSVLATVLLFFAGIEMSAVHAKEVQNPQKNYPKAILLSSVLIVFILSFGALAIATVVPEAKIELASGTIEAFKYFLESYNLAWLIPIIALFMAIGALGMVSTWIVGPTKGISATARHGELPPFLQKMNKKNMPVNILIVQAIVVTILSLLFLYMPTVSDTYRILLHLTAQLYLVMYFLMFISGIVLRYKRKDVIRKYKIPFGNKGMWIAGLLGAIGSLFAMSLGFLPPKEFERPYFFSSFLLIGMAFFFIIPFIIHKLRKPSWHIHKKE